MKVRDFIDQYKNGTVQTTDTLSYDVRDVVQDNIRLWNGKYTKDTFADGTKKIFYNILYSLFDAAYRNTDLDTKDVAMHSLNGKKYNLIPLLRMAVISWMKRGYFGEFLNEMRQELIAQGHVIAKIVDGKPYVVNPLNIIVPPHVKSIQDSGCVEMIQWTWDDMKSHKEEFKDKWTEIEECWEKIMKRDQPYFTIYEHWKMDDFRTGKEKKDGKLETITKGCIQYLEMPPEEEQEKSDKNPSSWEPQLELRRFKSPTKLNVQSKAEQKRKGKQEEAYPYIEQQFVKIQGRYWGVGMVELCKGVQEDYNETMNLGRKQRRLDLRGILVHRQPADGERSVSQEFLNSVETGAIIDVEQGEDLTRLNTQSKTADVIGHIDKLFEIGRQITGITAQATMEDTPSSTTATVAVLNQQQAKSTYDMIVEQQALFLTRLFQDFLLPAIVEELDAEEVIAITGDHEELKELDKYWSEQWVLRNIVDTSKKEGVFGITEKDTNGNKKVIPIENEDQFEFEVERKIEETKQTGSQRFTSIKKEMLKDLDYAVEFYVNNESFDKNTRIQNLLSLLTNQNTLSSREKIEREVLDLLGFSGKKFEKSEAEREKELQDMQAQAMAEQGGEQTAGTMGNEFANNNQV